MISATMGRRIAFVLVLGALVWPHRVDPAPQPQTATTLKLPLKEGSLRFAVLGDTGTGGREQYELASKMAAVYLAFPFEFVIMVGDNIIGADTPGDMANKFSIPYKALLDKGIPFRAVLGNHDVRFFALETDYLDKPQIEWLEKELESSNSEWKIAFFHHPLYSSGKAHGSSLETRAILEPLFVKYGLSAAFSGHDHVYERIKPQKGGIGYWVSGAGGRQRVGDVRVPSPLTAKGFDRDCTS